MKEFKKIYLKKKKKNIWFCETEQIESCGIVINIHPWGIEKTLHRTGPSYLRNQKAFKFKLLSCEVWTQKDVFFSYVATWGFIVGLGPFDPLFLVGPLLHLVNRVVNKDSKSFFEFLYLFMLSLIIREFFFFCLQFCSLL